MKRFVDAGEISAADIGVVTPYTAQVQSQPAAHVHLPFTPHARASHARTFYAFSHARASHAHLPRAPPSYTQARELRRLWSEECNGADASQQLEIASVNDFQVY